MKNYVKEKIRRKESVIGIWAIIPSPMLTEVFATSGLDFVILDMEHGAFDMSLLAECVRATAGTQCSPLVRIPYVEQSLIQRVLDMGAHGVVAPQIKSRADAEFLVSCCRFSPLGVRGYNPFTKAGNFLSDHNSAYFEDDFPLITVIIENLEAYIDLDGLLMIDGIDSYYLGIYDMSCAFGSRGNMESSEINDFIADSSKRIASAGKTIGKMVNKKPLLSNSDKSSYFYVLPPDAYIIKKGIIDKL